MSFSSFKASWEMKIVLDTKTFQANRSEWEKLLVIEF